MKHWRKLICLMALPFASTLTSTARCDAWSTKGTPHQATRRGEIDFAATAEAQARRPQSVEQRFVHSPLADPFRVASDLDRRNRSGAAGAVPPSMLLGLPSPSTSVSFQAALDNGWIPPDTHGAVGPSHLVTVHNGLVRVQSRTGTTLSSVDLSDFWAPVESSSYVFDPKVLYDPYNDRWIITALAAGNSPDSSVLIGASQGGNPLGLWNLYRIDADASNTYWADYPSIGFNRDWIAVQENKFPVGSSAIAVPHPEVFLFDKAEIYSGGPGSYKNFVVPTGLMTAHPAITYDENLATLYFLQTWTNDDTHGHGLLRMLTIDGALGAEVLSYRGAVTAPMPWSLGFLVYNFLPQLGTSSKIEAFDDRIRTVIYRNGSLWATHSIKLPSTFPPERTAVQWFEIGPDRSIRQHGLIDSPTGGQFFDEPSLGVNGNNDVLIGYSRFSASQYASANYAFRRAGDPAGSVRDDTVMKAGETPYDKDYGTGRNRWGDYSATLVDPVNDRDLWTIQEYAASPGDTWGTWWGKITVDCGDGVINSGEECDDGNAVQSDGCTNNCTICGNGMTTAPEQCDDGNLIDDDGCDANCRTTACGNGILTSGELCDDGNVTSNDGCDENCTPTACGNGIVTAGEGCDDGNAVDGDGCQADCTVTPSRDNVVLPLKHISIRIPSGTASVSKTIKVKVLNGDILPIPEIPGHTVQLTADLGDCPGGTISSGPDFGAGVNTITLVGGASAAATVNLNFAAASFNSFNRLAPTRCTLSFSAATVPAGDFFDPSPANSSATLDINVLDLNDVESIAAHESLLLSLKPVKLNIARGKGSATKTFGVTVRNADYTLAENPGDTLTLSASDGTCPAGTVVAVDMDPLPDPQSSIVVAGGAAAKGKVTITALSAVVTSANKKSPQRCSITLAVVGPGGDTDAANSTTTVPIDIVDKNDF